MHVALDNHCLLVDNVYILVVGGAEVVSVHIRDVDEDTWREARAYAVRRGWPMGRLVSEALAVFIGKTQPDRAVHPARGQASETKADG